MDLWVQQIDTGDPVQLTRGLGFCRDPAFSPDGSKIVLHCGAEPGGLYVVPTFGGLPKRLGDGELPEFSPDGSQISYKGYASREQQYTLRRSGSCPPAAGAGKRDQDRHDRKRNWRHAGMEPGRQGPPVHRIRRPDRRDVTIATGTDVLDRYRRGHAERSQAAIGGGRTGSRAEPRRDTRRCVFAERQHRQHQYLPDAARPGVSKTTADPVPLIVGAGFNFSPTASQDGQRDRLRRWQQHDDERLESADRFEDGAGRRIVHPDHQRPRSQPVSVAVAGRKAYGLPRRLPSIA